MCGGDGLCVVCGGSCVVCGDFTWFLVVLLGLW